MSSGGYQEYSVTEQSGDRTQQRTDQVALERPVVLSYNGISQAVMLCTPLDLEAFALGFSLTEGIIDSAADIYGVTQTDEPQGTLLEIELSSRCTHRLKQKRRQLQGRTGCGICGLESLEQLEVDTRLSERAQLPTLELIAQAQDHFKSHQRIKQATGATHAAALFSPQGRLLAIFEDVGRHNALDKLIGTLLQHPEWVERDLFVLVSSRASYEMVMKCVKAGLGNLLAVSAATSFAVDLARKTGLNLLGYCRDERYVNYG